MIKFLLALGAIAAVGVGMVLPAPALFGDPGARHFIAQGRMLK